MEGERSVGRGPGWRAWVISILVAIVLSVAATLLLGGDFPFGVDGRGTGGCGFSVARGPGAPDGGRGGK
jgi:hypothetical protein